MAIDKNKTYRVGILVFGDVGHVVYLRLLDSDGEEIIVHLKRNGKNVTFGGNELPLSVESKIRQSLPELDKIGKKLQELK